MSYIYKSSIQEQALFGDLKELLGETFKKSKLVHLESMIDWDTKADLISPAYAIIGRNGVGVRIMMALQILKGIRHGVSDRDLVNSLQTDLEVMWFCGLRNINDATKFVDSSSLTKFRNRISEVEGLMEKLQAIHVERMVKDTIPYRKRGQYDQDSTVVEEKVAYPNDVDLLSKIISVATRVTKQGKNFVGERWNGVINKGKQIAKELQLSYHFAKEKGEDKIITIKKSLVKIGEHTMKQMKILQKDLEVLVQAGEKQAISLHKKFVALIDTGTKILAQQSEMIRNKTKKVTDRILSLHKPHLRPMIKGKKGKPIEVGAKVQIGVIGKKVAFVVQHNWDNVHDSQTVKKGIETFEDIRGKKPKEAGFDKGYRSKEVNDPYLKEAGIDNGIQGSEPWKEVPLAKRKRLYNRRAGAEPLMNDIKNHRGANKNLLKKENSKQGLIWSIMASNYVRMYI